MNASSPDASSPDATWEWLATHKRGYERLTQRERVQAAKAVAASGNSLFIKAVLEAEGSMACVNSMMRGASRPDVLQWLHHTYNGSWHEALRGAQARGDLPLMEWILQMTTATVSIEDMEAAMRAGQQDVVDYLLTKGVPLYKITCSADDLCVTYQGVRAVLNETLCNGHVHMALSILDALTFDAHLYKPCSAERQDDADGDFLEHFFDESKTLELLFHAMSNLSLPDAEQVWRVALSKIPISPGVVASLLDMMRYAAVVGRTPDWRTKLEFLDEFGGQGRPNEEDEALVESLRRDFAGLRDDTAETSVLTITRQPDAAARFTWLSERGYSFAFAVHVAAAVRAQRPGRVIELLTGGPDLDEDELSTLDFSVGWAREDAVSRRCAEVILDKLSKTEAGRTHAVREACRQGCAVLLEAVLGHMAQRGSPVCPVVAYANVITCGTVEMLKLVHSMFPAALEDVNLLADCMEAAVRKGDLPMLKALVPLARPAHVSSVLATSTINDAAQVALLKPGLQWLCG